MVKVLITGGAGFIGSNLSDFLTKKKYKVTIIDNLSTGNKRNIKNKKINFIYSNINNINKLKKIGNFDVIVHLAAMAEILITKKATITFALHQNVLSKCLKPSNQISQPFRAYHQIQLPRALVLQDHLA